MALCLSAQLWAQRTVMSAPEKAPLTHHDRVLSLGSDGFFQEQQLLRLLSTDQRRALRGHWVTSKRRRRLSRSPDHRQPLAASLARAPDTERTYRRRSLAALDGFHKTQGLRRGRANVVHAAVPEAADGRALVRGHERPVEPAEDERGGATGVAVSGSQSRRQKNSLCGLSLCKPHSTWRSISC